MVTSLLAMMSCGNDAAVVDDDDNAAEQVQICFTISMAGSTTRTRATTWGDDYETETATYNENTIDPDKFQVLFFDADGKYLDQLGNLSYFRYSDSDNGTYDVVGTLSVGNNYVKDNKLNGKMVVLANYDEAVDVSSLSTLSDISANTFAYTNHTTENIAAGTAYIPMFGVTTLNGLQMNAGYRTNAGTVYMLRAMAKVIVNLNLDSNGNGVIDTGEEYAITSAELTNCNQAGYIVPKDYANVSNTTELTMADLSLLDWDKDNTFNPDSNSSTTTITFEKESDSVFYAYVPECVISNDNRPTFSIRFDFMTDTYPSYTFGFDEYENGVAKNVESYNIERNHVYTFTITKGKGSFSISTDNWANTFDNEYTF